MASLAERKSKKQGKMINEKFASWDVFVLFFAVNSRYTNTLCSMIVPKALRVMRLFQLRVIGAEKENCRKTQLQQQKKADNANWSKLLIVERKFFVFELLNENFTWEISR